MVFGGPANGGNSSGLSDSMTVYPSVLCAEPYLGTQSGSRALLDKFFDSFDSDRRRYHRGPPPPRRPGPEPSVTGMIGSVSGSSAASKRSI